LRPLRNSTFPHAILAKTGKRFVLSYEKFGLGVQNQDTFP
jgi:hypothetical protein